MSAVNKLVGPLSPDSGGDLVLDAVTLGYSLDQFFREHVIQIFGFAADVSDTGGSQELICQVYALGPAGESVTPPEAGVGQVWTALFRLQTSSGATNSPNSAADTHTLLLEPSSSGGPALRESIADRGLHSININTSAIKLSFLANGEAWAQVNVASRANIQVYVKSVAGLRA